MRGHNMFTCRNKSEFCSGSICVKLMRGHNICLHAEIRVNSALGPFV